MDANLIIRRVQPNPPPEVSRIWRVWTSAGTRLHAPTLAMYEVVNGLYQSAKAGLLTRHAVAHALRAVDSMPIKLHGDHELHRQALQNALHHGLPAAYDAHYLALAERLSAELWTTDAKLAGAVQDRLAWVRLMS